MRQDFCDVTVLLDRSGSMASIQMATINGFNAFVEKQRTVPGDCAMTLIQFGGRFEPNYEAVPVRTVAPLTLDTYIPHGSTALNDAVIAAIDRTGERLKALPEAERPAKVVMLIITDGHENASQHAKRDVLKKIREQETQYNWEFVYIGAFADAFDEAAQMGVTPAKSMKASKTHDGIQMAYRAVSSNMAFYRSGAASTMAFTKAQQDEQDADAR